MTTFHSCLDKTIFCSGSELGITSDGFFSLQERPEKVVVVGAGYIAVEMAQVQDRSKYLICRTVSHLFGAW